MPNDAETPTSETGARHVTRWPLWAAAVAATIAATLMVVAVVGWRVAEGDADDAIARADAAEARAAQQSEDLGAARAATEEAQGQAEVLDGMIQPGMAGELAGVYLRLAVAACADRTADPSEVIDQVATEATAASELLASHPGWELAIDESAVDPARANCDE